MDADPATLDGLLERSSRAASGFRQVYKLSSGKFTAWLGGKYLGSYSLAREAAFARAMAFGAHGGRSSKAKGGGRSSSSSKGGGGRSSSSSSNTVVDKDMEADEAAEADASASGARPIQVRKLPRNVYKLTGSKAYSVIISIGGVKTHKHGFATPQEAKAVAERMRAKLATSGQLPPNWETLDHGDLLEAMLARRQKPPRRKGARKGWTAAEKAAVLERQGGRCKAQYPGCSGQLLEHRVEFDHVDGDATNKALSNAQALCCNCHAFKTRCITR